MEHLKRRNKVDHSDSPVGSVKSGTHQHQLTSNNNNITTSPNLEVDHNPNDRNFTLPEKDRSIERSVISLEHEQRPTNTNRTFQQKRTFNRKRSIRRLCSLVCCVMAAVLILALVAALIIFTTKPNTTSSVSSTSTTTVTHTSATTTTTTSITTTTATTSTTTTATTTSTTTATTSTTTSTTTVTTTTTTTTSTTTSTSTTTTATTTTSTTSETTTTTTTTTTSTTSSTTTTTTTTTSTTTTTTSTTTTSSTTTTTTTTSETTTTSTTTTSTTSTTTTSTTTSSTTTSTTTTSETSTTTSDTSTTTSDTSTTTSDTTTTTISTSTTTTSETTTTSTTTTSTTSTTTTTTTTSSTTTSTTTTSETSTTTSDTSTTTSDTSTTTSDTTTTTISTSTTTTSETTVTTSETTTTTSVSSTTSDTSTTTSTTSSTTSTRTTTSTSTTTTTTTACPVMFLSPVLYSTGTGSTPYAAVIIDVNNDNEPDIIAAETGTSNTGVLFNAGNGTFLNQTIYSSGASSGARGIVVIDVNADNQPDIITANQGSSTAGVQLNAGNGTFLPVTTYSSGASTSPNGLAVYDLNGDNKPDIVTANAATSNVGVLLNEGNGTFLPVVLYSSGGSSAPRVVAISDVNGDNEPDIITANQGLSTIGILLNAGNGTFSAVVSYSSGTGSAPRGIAVFDLNGDNKPDIVTGNTGSSTVGVLLNAGNGTFPTVTTYSSTTGSTPRGVTIADVNADNKPDIISANAGTHNVGVFLNVGNGTFLNVTIYSSGASSAPYSVAVMDVNNDNKSDIVSANFGTSNVAVLLHC